MCIRDRIHRAPNMDTLVALGSGASFVYSVYALFAMTDAQVNGDMAGVMSSMHEFYFESAAMILTLITVGKMLEARSKGRTDVYKRQEERQAPCKGGKAPSVQKDQEAGAPYGLFCGSLPGRLPHPSGYHQIPAACRSR